MYTCVIGQNLFFKWRHISENYYIPCKKIQEDLQMEGLEQRSFILLTRWVCIIFSTIFTSFKICSFSKQNRECHRVSSFLLNAKMFLSLFRFFFFISFTSSGSWNLEEGNCIFFASRTYTIHLLTAWISMWKILKYFPIGWRYLVLDTFSPGLGSVFPQTVSDKITRAIYFVA